MNAVRHADAQAGQCGAVDLRDDRRWCVLALAHPGEGHNRNSPRDWCRTWLEHERHDPECALPDGLS